MNHRMWAHPATQANVADACRARRRADRPRGGRAGRGRVRQRPHVGAGGHLRAASRSCSRRPISTGRSVLVSAGGTREPLDAVRFVGNRSSGRMGVALAEEARRRGAAVTLLAANLAVPAPHGVEVVETPTADALLREALGAGGRRPRPDGRRRRRLPAGRRRRRASAPKDARAVDDRARADRGRRQRRSLRAARTAR